MQTKKTLSGFSRILACFLLAGILMAASCHKGGCPAYGGKKHHGGGQYRH